MSLEDLSFPDPPEGSRDPELWSILAQYEFVRWVRDDYPADFERLRQLLLSDLPRVVAATEESEPLFRFRAFLISIAVYRTERLDLILKALDDEDDFVRSKVASHLVSIRHPQVEGRLVELLLTDSSPDVRSAACHGLAGQDPLSVIPVLLRVLESDDCTSENGYVVSHQAADALDEIMGTELMARRSDGVCSLADSPSDLDTVREHAIAYLESLRNEDEDSAAD